jgi:hypothetical protein
MTRILLAVGIAAVLIAGCGSSTQARRTASAEKCFKNALIQKHLRQKLTRCKLNESEDLGRSYVVNVHCTYYKNSEYVCQVKTDNAQNQRTDRFYDLIDDGQSIEWRPAQ